MKSHTTHTQNHFSMTHKYVMLYLFVDTLTIETNSLIRDTKMKLFKCKKTIFKRIFLKKTNILFYILYAYHFIRNYLLFDCTNSSETLHVNKRRIIEILHLIAKIEENLQDASLSPSALETSSFVLFISAKEINRGF